MAEISDGARMMFSDVAVVRTLAVVVLMWVVAALARRRVGAWAFALACAAALYLFAEMVNTLVEMLVDRISLQPHRFSARIKHAAAFLSFMVGAVAFALLAVVGVKLFFGTAAAPAPAPAPAPAAAPAHPFRSSSGIAPSSRLLHTHTTLTAAAAQPRAPSREAASGEAAPPAREASIAFPSSEKPRAAEAAAEPAVPRCAAADPWAVRAERRTEGRTEKRIRRRGAGGGSLLNPLLWEDRVARRRRYRVARETQQQQQQI